MLLIVQSLSDIYWVWFVPLGDVCSLCSCPWDGRSVFSSVNSRSAVTHRIWKDIRMKGDTYRWSRRSLRSFRSQQTTRSLGGNKGNEIEGGNTPARWKFKTCFKTICLEITSCSRTFLWILRLLPTPVGKFFLFLGLL